jgi:putative hemolysin
LNILFETLIIFVLLVANGLLAMSEIAIVSARKARLQQLADEGNSQARIALELAAEPNQFLATIQIGITLVGILAGAFGGATLAEKIGSYFNTVPLLAPYGEAIGLGIVVLGITYFSLVIGELVPKRVALNNAERIAVAVARPMRLLSTITSPLVWLLSVSTDAVLRLLAIKPSTEPAVTEEEIRVLIEQGTQIGIFEEAEQDMIEGVLRLDDRRVYLVMTPRHQIVWLDIDDSPEQIRQKVTKSQHSRFPVVAGDLDNVLGVVQTKDLLTQALAGQPLDLQAWLRPPLFIPESISGLQVLNLFKQERSHLALVTDEYGGVEGLVTSDDILEAIVGDLPSLESPAEPAAVRRDDGSWLVDGMLHIDDLKEIFDLESLPGEEYGNYQTVGGFVINQLGSIPRAGQHFEWGDMRFEVIDMDGRRVDKVLVTQNQPNLSPEIDPDVTP